MCQLSKRLGKQVEATTVHHIFPRSRFPEYQYSDWNLISLSASAHNSLHIRDTEELTDAGKELLRRTCRKYSIPIPDEYC